MTDEPSPTGPLTSTQRTRIDCARRDYEQARAEDLGRLSDAALILLVARILTRLGDALDLIDEITDPS
ncbi:hypothetical protein [Streptomyces sp. YIM S03343]